MKRASILIVDDHEVVLKGLSQIVREAVGEEAKIDTVARGRDAIDAVSRTPYSLCLLDISLPDMDGVELMHSLRRNHPDMKIIVNTVHEQLWYVKEYLAARVEGILFKDINATEIARAILTVLDGGEYYCASVRTAKAQLNAFEAPTPREIEVLHLLAQGATTEQIAEQLRISVNTIESHRRHLLEKLNARNVAELILNAVAHGLIPINRHQRR